MSVLATAGRAKIYNTDGTGRDTYIGSNNGGFSVMNQATKQPLGGSFGPTVGRRSYIFGGSPTGAKPVHYPINGTGRDSYIFNNDGGLSNSYITRNARDAYVGSLRSYPQSHVDRMRVAVVAGSPSPDRNAPRKRDYFAEGQMSVRQPKARYGLSVIHTHQKALNERLAAPRRAS